MTQLVFLGQYRVYQEAVKRLLEMADFPAFVAPFELNLVECQPDTASPEVLAFVLDESVLCQLNASVLACLPVLPGSLGLFAVDIQTQRQQFSQAFQSSKIELANSELVSAVIPSEVLVATEVNVRANENNGADLLTALTSLIESLSKTLALPLQVRANDFSQYHRHFPIRRPKNIAPTALYFQTECLDLQQAVVVERIYHDHFNYVAVVKADKQGVHCLKLFGLNHDHGVLQDIFEDRVLQQDPSLNTQLAHMMYGAAKVFSDSTVFSLYFSANAQQLLFSHCNIGIDLPSFLVTYLAVISDEEKIEVQLPCVAARLVYQELKSEKLFAEDAKALSENKLRGTDNTPATFVKLLENNEKQLDCPFGVTIARHYDVRQALRQAIRYENVLSGRLESY